MGLNESMDSFNICTDFIISNMAKTLKSVDDILGPGQNPQELYNQIKTVLTKIIQHKFKISKKKFKVGTQIDFWGYTIRSQKVESLQKGGKSTTNVTNTPNPEKIKAI